MEHWFYWSNLGNFNVPGAVERPSKSWRLKHKLRSTTSTKQEDVLRKPKIQFKHAHTTTATIVVSPLIQLYGSSHRRGKAASIGFPFFLESNHCAKLRFRKNPEVLSTKVSRIIKFYQDSYGSQINKSTNTKVIGKDAPSRSQVLALMFWIWGTKHP